MLVVLDGGGRKRRSVGAPALLLSSVGVAPSLHGNERVREELEEGCRNW